MLRTNLDRGPLVNDVVYRSILEGDDNSYYQLILVQARKVTSGNLAHPEGRRWNSNDAFELVSEYFLTPSYVAVLLSATDDDSLNALVYTSLKNQVIRGSRDNDRARLRLRLKEILHQEAFVEYPVRFWRRATDPIGAFHGRESDLLEAVWQVDIKVVRWSPEAKRNSPVAERTSFLALLETIFIRAGGAVDERMLLEVLARRFGIGPVSYMESLDARYESIPADLESSPEDHSVAMEISLDAAARAVEVWAELGPDERRMVALATVSARYAAEKLGFGKTKANGIQTRLKAKIALLLRGVTEPQRLEIWTKLQELAAVRTSDGDPAS